MFGPDISFFIMIIVIIAVIVIIIRNAKWNHPTWKGIIISALLAMLPLYLFFCMMGWMGEERSNMS